MLESGEGPRATQFAAARTGESNPILMGEQRENAPPVRSLENKRSLISGTGNVARDSFVHYPRFCRDPLDGTAVVQVRSADFRKALGDAIAGSVDGCAASAGRDT